MTLLPTSVAGMKRAATSLLVLAGVVFALARIGEDGRPWLGFVRATAEAAMVGALADWFAVTALFRHPLGLPIPHTAIIPRRKAEIGRSLGEFVRDHFLTEENLTRLMREEGLGRELGAALAHPLTAARIAEQLAAVIRGITEVLNDELVQSGLEQHVFERLRAVPVSPLAGKAIDWGMAGGHHEVLVDSTLVGLARFLNDNRETFRRRLKQESPWWVPEAVDDRVFEKIYEAVNRFVDEVGGNRNHELRHQLNERTYRLAERLKTAPELEVRGEELKDEILSNAEVRVWVGGLWTRIKAGLVEATHDHESELRVRIQEAIVEAGEAIQNDPALQHKMEMWIGEAAGYAVSQGGGDAVVNLISGTVDRWDAAETTELIEIKVGRDLQFIRINGTIVGGTAGLVLYTISELLA